jgi:hypothetical protein
MLSRKGGEPIKNPQSELGEEWCVEVMNTCIIHSEKAE